MNSIHPGFIDTPMIAPFLKDEAGNRSRMAQWIEAMTPLKRVGTPAEVAEVVVFVASDAASYTTGSEVYVDGGGGPPPDRARSATPYSPASEWPAPGSLVVVALLRLLLVLPEVLARRAPRPLDRSSSDSVPRAAPAGCR